MSNLGMGVMIRMLCGNEDTVNAVKTSLGKVIAEATLEGEADTLKLTFEDGSTLRLWDDGQSCCECRYMRTDDDLSYHVGATLHNIELRDGPTEGEDEFDVHDVQFLLVTTSKGVITCVNHNEHNGYYGGFAIEASLT